MREAIQVFSRTLAGIAVTVCIATPVCASTLLQSLSFTNNTLVITSQAPFGKPKLESWESKSGNTPTRMVVLDLPGAFAEKAQLDKLVENIHNANIRRLIATPMPNETVRVVLEVSHRPEETIEPVLSQNGNETRLSLVPVSTAKPRLEEAPKPAQNTTAQKEIGSLKAELEIANAQRAAFQKKNQLLEVELQELKSTPAAAQADNAHETESLKAELRAANAERDALEKKADALSDEITRLKKQPVQTADSSSELLTLKQTLEKERSVKEELTLANQALVKKIQKLQNDGSNSGNHLQAALDENVRLQQALEESKKKNKNGAKEDAHENWELESALNSTVAERNQLLQQNEALQKQISDLRGKLVEQDDVIGQTVPGNRDVADNLRIALVRTVQKLKAAEEEIVRLKGGAVTPVAEEAQPQPLEEAMAQEPSTAQGFFTPTREQLEYTIRNKPDNYDAYIKLQGIYMRERDYARAEAVLQNLLMVNPRYPDAYYALSEVYLLQNNPVHARASLETYKRLRPGDANRITALEQRINTINPQ